MLGPFGIVARMGLPSFIHQHKNNHQDELYGVSYSDGVDADLEDSEELVVGVHESNPSGVTTIVEFKRVAA